VRRSDAPGHVREMLGLVALVGTRLAPVRDHQMFLAV
jgi:hypothetical protein